MNGDSFCYLKARGFISLQLLRSPCTSIVATPDTLPLVCVDPNPDISGIGVRVAIYVQAFVNIACVIIFSLDNHISGFEHKVLINASLNLFVSGCALLICTAVQGTTFGLSLHHALIVLNLNWIIAFSGLLYVLIFAYNHVKGQFGGRRFGPGKIEPATMWLAVVSGTHLCGMGAVGIWVWVKSKTFGGQPECNSLTSLRIFGKKLNALDPTLRKASIAVYAIATVPVVNLLVVLLFALIIIGFVWLFYWAVHGHFQCFSPPWRGFVLSGAIAVVLALDTAFIVSTELMISRGCVKVGEGQWTYGQTLALVGLIIPLIDTMKMLKLWIGGVERHNRFGREDVNDWTVAPTKFPFRRL
ncbi:hypothetical protein EST38_g12650 [Candolleomyces aberdarensis]|uniref:Uncharacterized protein n=1 Tax=Candolleomyces aberdarensis TaxID=2316362 RepID=A0A4Q2D4D9_9AGAR|nr:hypothetical protein EST38_g12650 [Candolleomyces aberdarensis]